MVSGDWLLQKNRSRTNFLGVITGFGGTMAHTAFDFVTTSSYLKQGQVRMLGHSTLVLQELHLKKTNNWFNSTYREGCQIGRKVANWVTF